MPLKFPCKVIEIQDHREGVYSVLLQPQKPAPRFKAGQFLHLALDEYTPGGFWPESKPFSIASPPSDRQHLRITYAVKGHFTTRMQGELRLGGEVWVKMPYGDFIIHGDQDVCLLAGGTGITAFSAFLSELKPEHPHMVHLFYGARRPDLLIYRSMLEAIADRCPCLRIICLAEHEATGSGCLPGRMDAAIIINNLQTPLGLNYYIAGPPEMVRDLVSGLEQQGVPQGQVRVDAWE
jgi:ferredoxin-NADP reductase